MQMSANLKSTAESLQQELCGLFHVVAQPDHPMLLSGPDIIIGGEGKLTAIIWPGTKESNDSLLARITATRLAFPAETRLLAVLNEGTRLPERVLSNFDEIAGDFMPERSIIQYASSDAIARVDLEALKESKRLHSEKFAFAMLMATLRHKHDSAPVATGVAFRDLYQDNPSTLDFSDSALNPRIPMMQIKGSVVTSLTPGGRVLPKLRAICNAGFTHGYQLDTGIPCQNPGANLNILLVEDWPLVKHDPIKPLRSTAFGCWIMTKASSTNDILELVDRSLETKYTRRWQNA